MKKKLFSGKMDKAMKVYYSRWASIIFLVLLTYAVYWGSLSVPFMWDDDNLIIRDEQIKSLTNIFHVFFIFFYWKEDAPFSGAYFRPIRTVSFAIDYFLWGIFLFVYCFSRQPSAVSSQPSATDSWFDKLTMTPLSP
ncbi:MAG: hypothetical protein HY754_06880 [Nitrospirae bacterium]|nr:hypothetical protein [Nitrospirota bacterium]